MEPGQIIQWVIIGIFIAVFAYDKARGAWKRRNGNPGNFGERFVKIETEIKDMKEDIKLIKRKLNLI